MLASKDKISIRQAVILFLTLIYSPAMRFFPVFTSEQAKRAGWLAPVLAAVPFFCLVLIMQALFRKEQEASLSDLYLKIFGKFVGRIFLLIMLFWTMILLGLYVRYFAERFLSALMPNTSMAFFAITMLTVVFYVVRGGLVSFARTVEFLFVVFSLIFLLLFLLSVSNIEIINLLPVTHLDFWPVAKSTYYILGVWGYFSYVFFLADKFNDKEHVRRFGLQGMGYIVFTSVLLLIQTIGVYGYTIIRRAPQPYFLVIKSISIFDTIERIESVALAFWVIIDFVVIAVFMMIVISLLKSIFMVREGRPLVSPITLLAYILCFYVAHDRFELESFSRTFASGINIITGLGFPLLLLVVGKIRRKI